MAIKNENAYYKIIESTIDYINDRTTIVCDRYIDETDRIYEKNMKEQISSILNSAHTDLMTTLDMLVQEITSHVDVEQYHDEESYLEANPDIQAKYDTINELISEHAILLVRLLNSGVDLQSFKHKDYWYEHGLTDAMCRPVNKKGVRGICFDGKLEQELSSLYETLKTRIDNPVDC